MLENERTQVIVKEIEFWKEHHLLPDKYCDFLLALYTNGEEIESKQKSKIQLPKWAIILQVGLVLLLLPFSFLVIYFTKFPAILQLGILILFIVYSVGSYFYLKKKTKNLYHPAFVISLLLIFLLSLFISQHFIHSDFFNYVIIFSNFFLWFVLSRKNKLTYLMVTSVIGVIFSFIYIVL